VMSSTDFDKIARLYSEDKGTAKNGGKLPWFGTGRMEEGFENAAFGLKNDGDVSEPVRTRYGWHLIKRLEVKGLNSFDEMKADLKRKVSRDGRGSKSRESLIRTIKSDYGYNPDKSGIRQFYSLVDTSYFLRKWKLPEFSNPDQVLFTLKDTKYGSNTRDFTVDEFARFLEKSQQRMKPTNIKVVVDQKFEDFVNDACIQFEDANLENKHADFRALMNEYRDGILLFELMDQKVWSRALKDTAGLEEFYESHKNDYMWGERADASIYTCANETIAKKARKLAAKKVKKSLDDQVILDKLNKNSQFDLKIESGKFLKGDNEMVDKTNWEPGLSENQKVDGKIVFVGINKKLAPEPKSLQEARGLITADYQNFLEEEWIKELRGKYKVKVNREVLAQIK